MSAEHARLAAGALMEGVALMIDGLFEDVQALEEADATVADAEGLWVLDGLPEAFAVCYTPLFAKRFLVTTALLGHRLATPGWDRPLCTAEALALHLAVTVAQTQLEELEVADKLPVEQMLSTFEATAFDDDAHAELYRAEPIEEPEELDDELTGRALADWFTAPDGSDLHPYLATQGFTAEPDED